MDINQDNQIVQLCAKGMELEGQGRPSDAANVFNQAWRLAVSDFEKFVAAHYVARYQESISDKLLWDQIALKHALTVNDDTTNGALPSLYLNIGKCYEDLNDLDSAKQNYQSAFSHINSLHDDGYGNMIKAGINNALERLK